MKQLTTLEYLKMNGWNKFLYNLKCFFCAIPTYLLNLLKKIGNFFKRLGLGIWANLKDLWFTFVKGKWQTKVSFLIMGFGSICYGQPLRGALFMLFEIVFVLYMAMAGVHWLSKFDNLGDAPGHKVETEWGEGWVNGDDSFKILMYGLLTIIFIIALVYTWRLQIKQCRINEEIMASGKKVKSTKDDMKSLLDNQYHKTLLALPLTGIAIFTVFPIIFMILVAFTNYDASHDGRGVLFTWQGLKNFAEIINFSNGDSVVSMAFGEILVWTLIWAFFATFTNYFLGMFVAMMINKKGIQFKKGFRTILVMTIAIPQFISLLYVSNMFSQTGLISKVLQDWGWISGNLHLFDDKANPILTRVWVIIINIWIGIPYLMLIATGILMNIPADLYESAKIDGATGIQQFGKITLPYMLFVTGPYLLTSFTGNLNNFNVIYLLTGGTPVNSSLSGASGSVGYTDILITWLFKITQGTDSKYYLASVVGIMIFVVVSVISLIVYNVMPSNRNEGDFS